MHLETFEDVFTQFDVMFPEIGEEVLDTFGHYFELGWQTEPIKPVPMLIKFCMLVPVMKEQGLDTIRFKMVD